jgi:hypothetical protein
MAGNPRENTRKKGFWDGGSKNHGRGDQGSGRHSGFPGGRRPSKVGIQVDLFSPVRSPAEDPASRAEEPTPSNPDNQY